MGNIIWCEYYFLVFGTGAEELQRLRDEATSDAEEKNEDPPSFNCGSLYFKFIIKVKVLISLIEHFRFSHQSFRFGFLTVT